ncbi:hypothetical protein EVAR_42561_1 [Eumeta japonica]|uniref:Uncharacterized protein n=1 Tax=Eumeta variegata TaxID=151549 RepID=A0A4C1WRD8_EUMVA|nr:hypothetical protein EVAR_42561_1 [Eumeta japonica]
MQWGCEVGSRCYCCGSCGVWGGGAALDCSDLFILPSIGCPAPQTLKAAWDTQSLTTAYLLKWACSARESLDRLEATAAPAGWRCHFLREAGQYAYTREADGHTQLAYPTAPAPGHDDMDISTTPPHSDEQVCFSGLVCSCICNKERFEA